MTHHLNRKPQVGLWIDHRNAMIVTLLPSGAEVTSLMSHAERHGHRATPYAHAPSHPVAPEDSRDRRYQGQLQNYYDMVIDEIQNADAVFIFGPGEAKIELKARMEERGMGDLVTRFEAAGQLTENQIVQRVRTYYQSLNIIQSARLTENAGLALPVKMPASTSDA